MALNKGWDRHFFINNVMTEGRSLNVTKGQFAVVNNSAAPNKDGRKVISDFQGLPKDTQLAILQGIAKDGEARTQSNKPWSTEEFSINEVLGLRVGVPSTDFEVDRFVIGYNGFDDDTALSLENGENESLQVSLSGEAIGMLGYKDATATFTFEVGKPNTGTMTDQEMIEELVLRMRRAEFQGGVPITKYLDIDVVNSTNPAVGALTGTTDSVFYNITVTDNGDSLGYAAVQAQYPNYKVVKTERSGDESTYTIVAPTGTTLADFEKFKRSKIKGCESCPAGYSEFEDGFVYSITLEDDGADSTATIEGDQTTTFGVSEKIVAGSTTKVNQNDGVSYYTFIADSEITDAEIDAFVDANESAVIELASRDVQEICAPTNLETVAWSAGETCKATTEAYTIIVGDDECGTPRTQEVKDYYPDLTIVQDATAQCATKLSTSVTTNIVCEACDPAFRDLFTSEAPEPFKGIEWKKAEKNYDAAAKMGIRLTGKKIEMSGSEAYRDFMPFLASSVRISVAGGYYGSQTSSYHEGSGDRFHVEQRSRATEPEYLGGNLQELEEMSRRYFEDSSRQYQNAFGTWAKGEESLLNPTSPYVDYVLTVRTKTLSQAFSGERNETFYYHFITEVGKHQEVEAILNRLATEAGVAPVQAFGKTAV
jgi:hypothetical protein